MNKDLLLKFCLMFTTFALVTAHVSPVAAADEWITDTKSGCQVLNQDPQPGETVEWSGACQKGKASGYGIMQWYVNGNAGNKYVGEYSNGKRNGKSKKTVSNGSYFDGYYVDNKKSGFGVEFIANGFMTRGVLPNDKILGPVTVYGMFENDILIRRFYIACSS